jgi:hypothetical protein
MLKPTMIMFFALGYSVIGVQGNMARAANNNEETAINLAIFLRSARAVISEHQDHINDPSKGDKKLCGETVLRMAKDNFKSATGTSIDNIDPATVQGKLFRAEMDAILSVMNDAQDLINQKDVGFKGFIPAVFATYVTERFRDSMRGIANMKLTAPMNYVRNRANIPDEWESHVIETKFKTPAHERGSHFSETVKQNGDVAYRLILPEYYERSCLACHGEPKGERDITGGKKEGGKLGDLGGAISVTIFE